MQDIYITIKGDNGICNKLTSVFYASVMILIINFDITLSK